RFDVHCECLQDKEAKSHHTARVYSRGFGRVLGHGARVLVEPERDVGVRRPIVAPACYHLSRPRGRALAFLEPLKLMSANEPRGLVRAEGDEPRRPAKRERNRIENVELARLRSVGEALDGDDADGVASDAGLESAYELLIGENEVEVRAV